MSDTQLAVSAAERAVRDIEDEIASEIGQAAAAIRAAHDKRLKAARLACRRAVSAHAAVEAESVANDEPGEKMDLYFSVFNCHVNNADERARQALLDEGRADWLEEVDTKDREGGGIMAIFDSPPTPATRRYAELVTAFVNENRVDPPVQELAEGAAE